MLSSAPIRLVQQSAHEFRPRNTGDPVFTSQQFAFHAFGGLALLHPLTPPQNPLHP